MAFFYAVFAFFTLLMDFYRALGLRVCESMFFINCNLELFLTDVYLFSVARCVCMKEAESEIDSIPFYVFVLSYIIELIYCIKK